MQALQQISKEQRNRLTSLLMKIFDNILKYPSIQQYRNLNYQRIAKKIDLSSVNVLLQILLTAGFSFNDDAKRLVFDVTNLDTLKSINKLIKYESLKINSHDTKEYKLHQLLNMGFCKTEGIYALKAANYDMNKALNQLVNPNNNTSVQKHVDLPCTDDVSTCRYELYFIMTL
eukprot:186054_1